jgi:hypothetical protein
MIARRSFIFTIAALAAPCLFAQAPKVRRVGVLVNGSEATQGPRFEVFREALQRLG